MNTTSSTIGPDSGDAAPDSTLLLNDSARDRHRIPGRRPEASAEREGDVIGPYKLVERLGEGGFGTVWRAEQEEPIRRSVALKVIKAGMDTNAVISRFESERQTLALMDHPNIAKVLDAGTTRNGRPFFVMELVTGQPITEYCDSRRLAIRDRIALFIPVCRAVQHAHQKAILHRDLKPSNILVADVDGCGVPKVIDFGIAKALGTTGSVAGGGEGTLCATHPGMILGTLQYMSPEQAGSMPDVDTRSDVYTLGVILFELLTGTTPLTRNQLRELGFDELLRHIRESEAPLPSSRLAEVTEVVKTVATLRGTEPRRLGQSLRGDLDWIVFKALEKDRARRYGGASEIVEDLDHYLAEKPVNAGPPGVLYRLRKLVRRNRLLLGATAAVILALLTGVIVSTTQYVEAAQARRSMAIQAGAASYALAGEKLKSGEWADSLAYTAASLRVNPNQVDAARHARDLLFGKQAFCVDSLLPQDGAQVVASGYPSALVRGKTGLAWYEHAVEDQTGAPVWRQDGGETKQDGADSEERLISPGGRFRITLRREQLEIQDRLQPGMPLRQVPMSIAPEDRASAFSPDGGFLAIAGTRYVQVIDLPNAKVEWDFVNQTLVDDLTVENGGSPVIIASPNLPVAPTRHVQTLDLGSGSSTVVNIPEGTFEMFVASTSINLKAYFVHGSMLSPRLIISSQGARTETPLDGDVLAMSLSHDESRLSFISEEGDRKLKYAQVDLNSASKKATWLIGATTEDRLFWSMNKDLHGIAQNGLYAVSTAHLLQSGGGSDLVCFNLRNGRATRRHFDGRVVRVATANQAGLALVTTVQEPLKLETHGQYQFFRADVHLVEVENADRNTPPVLKGVRVGPDALSALSPDGKVFALGGPHGEQLSVHRSKDGAGLGFIRIETRETGKSGRGVFTSAEGPASLRSMRFQDSNTLHVAIKSFPSGTPGVGVVHCDGFKSPLPGWNPSERNGIGESVLLETKMVAPPPGVDVAPLNLEIAGWSNCFSNAYYFARQGSSTLHMSVLNCRPKSGQDGPALMLEMGFGVSGLTSIGGSGHVLFAGRHVTEAYDHNNFDRSERKPRIAAAEGSAFMVWNHRDGRLLDLGAARSMAGGNSPMIRIDGGISSLASAGNSEIFALGQPSGAIRLFKLVQGPSHIRDIIGKDFSPNPRGKILEEIRQGPPPAVGSPAVAMEFVRQNHALSVRYGDGTLRLWDIQPPAANPPECPSGELADLLEACAGKAIGLSMDNVERWGARVLEPGEVRNRRQRTATNFWSLDKRFAE